jgi:hypothetical protein
MLIAHRGMAVAYIDSGPRETSLVQNSRNTVLRLNSQATIVTSYGRVMFIGRRLRTPANLS